MAFIPRYRVGRPAFLKKANKNTPIITPAIKIRYVEGRVNVSIGSSMDKSVAMVTTGKKKVARRFKRFASSAAWWASLACVVALFTIRKSRLDLVSATSNSSERSMLTQVSRSVSMRRSLGNRSLSSCMTPSICRDALRGGSFIVNLV